MVWNPTNNTIDILKVTSNLFAFLETNQESAINWASGDNSLPRFKKLYRSAKGRISTEFPCLMLIDKSIATDFTGDLLKCGLRLLFEVQIQGGNIDKLVEHAEFYAKAVESLLTNIPPEVLVNGAFKPIVASMDGIETDFDEIRQNQSNKSAFLQVFQTEVTYILEGEAFAI